MGKRGLGKFFAGLPIRSKLIVLHNAFFLVLALSLYFALRAPLNQAAARAAAQEAELVAQLFEAAPDALRRAVSDQFIFREGTAEELGIDGAAQQWLREHPGRVRRAPPTWPLPDALRLARFEPDGARWQVVSVNARPYRLLARRWRLTFGGALAGVYALAVLVLEFLILPRYVYHPIRRILRADEALRAGASEREIIPAEYISGDEIGQIMASRNATVALLREQERRLKDALARLEETTNDLRRKNHLLETARRNLASQEHLAGIGLMSAGVAHEINTPLAVLHGSVEKMLEAPTDPANAERLRRMLRVTERLRGISESLTDFARARTQTMEVVRLRPVVEEAWSLVKTDQRADDVRFINETDENDLVIGNVGRLLQVFINLFKNGVDALRETPHGSRAAELRVSARRSVQEGRVWLVVMVEDNGPGIRPDILPRLFEPFVTSRLDARGTGLGLAVTEGIIHQHGGVIVASNRSGGGARFEITLPAPGEAENLKSQIGSHESEVHAE